MKQNAMVRLEPEERERVKTYMGKLADKKGINLSESAVLRMLVLRGLKEAERER